MGGRRWALEGGSGPGASGGGWPDAGHAVGCMGPGAAMAARGRAGCGGPDG
ncbi:MAG: hypothetical protein ACFFGP_13690 [Promethearchaeota archaeon]